MTRRYTCDFQNAGGEGVTIIAELTSAEMANAAAHPHPAISARAHALRRAYRLVPAGFLHSSVNPIEAH
jgi:hypothetical protein